MDISSTSILPPKRENPHQTAHIALSCIVAATSSVAAGIFTYSTYSIITYKAPLTFVAFADSPMISGALAAVAALVSIVALSPLFLSERVLPPSSIKEELSNSKPIMKEKNDSLESELSQKKSVKKSMLDQEVMEVKAQIVQEPQKKVEKEFFQDLIKNLTPEATQAERMEVLAGISIDEIQKYIEETDFSYRDPNFLEKFILLPLEVLRKLDVSKFSNDKVYLLCFGESSKLLKMRWPLKLLNNFDQNQANFEALFGGNEAQLIRFLDDRFCQPLYSADQLVSLKEKFNNHKERLNAFFPPCCIDRLPSENEKKRFSAFYTTEDVQSMLEKGGQLEFPVGLALNEYREYRWDWNYYIRLLSPEQIKGMNFSYCENEGRKILRFHPFQLLFMLDSFGKHQIEALKSEQRNQIKENLNAIIKVMHSSENQFILRGFLEDWWNEFVSICTEFFTEEEYCEIFRVQK